VPGWHPGHSGHMFVVVFRAVILNSDEHYLAQAKRMRELAIEKYGCLDITSATEADHEITVSYWQSKQHIEAWKKDAEHMQAQRDGINKWYRSYRIEVAEIVKKHGTKMA